MCDDRPSQETLTVIALVIQLISQVAANGESSLWAYWWTYHGISGPAYWGRMNSEWRLCHDGKLQSPIDIDPKRLLYDPTLKVLSIEGTQITGSLVNSGNDLRIDVDNEATDGLSFYSGPLCYRYKVRFIKFHWGTSDFSGSEHKIGGNEFPVEIQLLAYNEELYGNYSQAEMNAHGLLNLAVFAEIGNTSNRFLESIRLPLEKVRFKGEVARVKSLPLSKLLPQTKQYVTYEGSQTQPGCYETVTWIIMNKPIYISRSVMNVLRQLNEGGKENPIMLMKNNKRPLMPAHRRIIRTNINFQRGCTMKRSHSYSGMTACSDSDNNLPNIGLPKVVPEAALPGTVLTAMQTAMQNLLNHICHLTAKNIHGC